MSSRIRPERAFLEFIQYSPLVAPAGRGSGGRGSGLKAPSRLQRVASRGEGRRGSRHRVFTYFCLQSFCCEGNKKVVIREDTRVKKGLFCSFSWERPKCNYRLS